MTKPKNKQAELALLMVLGFFLAVGLRWLIGGRDVAQSYTAGLVFACCLWGLYFVKPSGFLLNTRVVVGGLLGGLFICIPLGLWRLAGHTGHTPQGNFWAWSLIIIFVAVAEEAVLRGSLFDQLTAWKNKTTALLGTAVLFALLHVPLYGWHVVPLDVVVGLWLGGLRLQLRSWVSPAIAHSLADLIAWWLK